MTTTSDVPAELHVTLWPSLYDTNAPTPWSGTWADLTQALSVHTRIARKEDSAGFGPYLIQAPAVTCRRHADLQPRTHAHRCDLCVKEMTLLVFDADQGDLQAVQECDRRLASAGLACLWYSTYSYAPDRPKAPFRLVVPLARPVAPEAYRAVREDFIRTYAVPADPSQCSGKSHYYHLPSCPPDGQPVSWAHEGRAYEPPAVLRHATPARAPVSTDGWEPPPEPTEPVDVEPLLETLRARARSLKRRLKASERGKGELLRRCLDGEPLAEHGSRDTATFRVAGMLPFLLPAETPLSVYQHIMRPSVDAMIAAGSSLTHEKVERALLTSMRNRWERDESNRQLREAWGAALEATRSEWK